MIPITGKIYKIDYVSDIAERTYQGNAECLGTDADEDVLYYFKLLDDEGGNALFEDEDIVKEVEEMV